MCVSNGKQAVDVAMNPQQHFQKDKHFDIVLMDINMPELDGITALKEIVPEGAKVIMLTMDGQQEFIVQADKAGALGYIAKPFSENQLMEKVNSVLCPSS